MWLCPKQEVGLEAGLNINNEATVPRKWVKHVDATVGDAFA